MFSRIAVVEAISLEQFIVAKAAFLQGQEKAGLPQTPARKSQTYKKSIVQFLLPS